MAYDEDLAERMRDALAGTDGLTEKKMFGGLAFLLHGNMTIAASSEGGALVRVHPDEGDRLIASGKAEPMVMRGRPMAGWLRVPTEQLRTAAQLRRWVDRGVAFTTSLPPKP